MKPSKNEYLVVDENTLVYVNPDWPTLPTVVPGEVIRTAEVLAGSVVRGGSDPTRGPISLLPNAKVRPATLADFTSFRVSPKGHLA